MSTERLAPRLHLAPYRFTAALRLERELGISHALAQVLVRRGLAEPDDARAFLAADARHDPLSCRGMEEAVAVILRHAGAGSRITVHGDYDVDGVCSTAILVRSLRRLGACVDWLLPSRLDDGYGLSTATVRTLAGRGTRLLVTVDCAITAVDEVAAARAAGLEVVVTDHHQPSADGRLPDAAIVHPGLGGYPCPELCASGVAAKLGEALERTAGGHVAAEDDLDLVALATIADCVPLRGENRRLVREGLRSLADTAKPGLRALMRVSQLDPAAVDAHAVAFRLAPRINAAGRLHRADAGLELVLTEDEGRAAQVAAELDDANARRRDIETRILFAAEAQVAERPERAAYVLTGDDWHPGVIGIVASRIAERHHRPTVLIALDGDSGTGSGRSIPGFDLLAALTACRRHLTRHGGHRAAAGLEIERSRLPAFAADFEAHAADVLTPDDLLAVESVDAVVGGDALDLSLAEELQRLAPFGIANPDVSLLLPAAAFAAPVPMADGKHVRFAVHGGGAHSRAVAFGVSGGRLSTPLDRPVDATFRLEPHAWKGAVEPRLVLRSARPSRPPPIDVVGEPSRYWDGVTAELDAPPAPWPPPPPASDRPRHQVDRRDRGIAGTVGDLLGTGETVLVVCAEVRRRLRGLQDRLGGFALCSWAALDDHPGLAAGFVHLVALDPPAHSHQAGLLAAAGGDGGFAHLAWGEPELRFARQINEQEYGLRAPLAALYRTLRDRDGAAGEELEAVLRADADRPRSPALAGRLLRVLAELRLVSLDRDRAAVSLKAAERTALERSPAFLAYEHRREDAERYLTRPTARAA
ncbi:MAG: single-stranded-DNA-specific exonuclease RecJ [Solirubrobacteraceae bacterium]